jgi:hypothetical protein
MVELVPFKSSSQASKLKICAEAIREKDELSVTFIITDKEKSIFWGERENLGRASELWKTTCFEAFIGTSGNKEYWELNFSASGSWNLYHFDFYRSTLKPSIEERVDKIKFNNQNENDYTTRIKVQIPIQNLNLPGKKLEVGLTSVIEFKDKEKSYFALKHVGDKPDFHQRDSFVCSLE